MIKSPKAMNPWMLENEPRMPSPIISLAQTRNLPFNFGASQLYDHNEPVLSTFRGHVTDYAWPQPTADLRLGSVPPIQPLPPKSIARELIEDFFTNYNRFLPLFDEDDFLREFQLKYSISSPADAAWWACLNVVLAIAHRLRAIPMLDPTQENTLAFAHAQNALNVVSKLAVSDHDLSAVQALAGIACVLQGTPNPAPAAMLVAAALRLAQSMNLHRECAGAAITEAEAEKRRRVFWKVYILDKDISLRASRPFGLDDDDMDVRLPANGNLEKAQLDLFHVRIGLALIQGQIYKQLYSVRAARQTPTQRGIAAQSLSSLLAYWKSSAQLQLAVNLPMPSVLPLSGAMIHKVVLQLTYTHCLTMIDCHLPPTAPLSYNQESSLSGPLLTPSNVCVVESRNAICLVEAIPQGDCACVW